MPWANTEPSSQVDQKCEHTTFNHNFQKICQSDSVSESINDDVYLFF